ncbi:MAG: CopG family transcriptional regulator [Segetibacter sp.]|jgi:ABC-type branched-subunit amino acid transport system substrate-binding protein|nr:CopG family transcriptional regulator [Segetibacter sp.]
MNNKNVTYTSTLPNIVMEEVVEYAKKKNVSKNKVIEIALKKFFEEEIKQELQNTFKLASEDKELIQMAEEGLGDYLNQLKELEK